MKSFDFKMLIMYIMYRINILKGGKMNTIAVTNARGQLSELINKVAYAKERISLTRQNKPVAYLISVEDMQLLEMLEDKSDILELEQDRESLKEPAVPLDEVKKELGL